MQWPCWHAPCMVLGDRATSAPTQRDRQMNKTALATAFGRALAYQARMTEDHARDAIHCFANTLHPSIPDATVAREHSRFKAYCKACNAADAAYRAARPEACATYRGLAHWADACHAAGIVEGAA